VVFLDHLPPLLDRRLSPKKSRSTTSWPILAWSFSKSASLVAAAASALPEKVEAMPSIAWRFQLAIKV
jgi:hypothetical protein